MVIIVIIKMRLVFKCCFACSVTCPILLAANNISVKIKASPECYRGSHLCDVFATCYDTIGSHICKCIIGFEGNGRICDDINECEIGRTSIISK